MSAYSELVKSFEKIRAYVREFYVYGFKSRDEYTKKSSRSYDDERRRLESWLGEYMGFTRTHDGKSQYISIDSRVSVHNPLYRAWKTKSFTDKDITLHFILLDILSAPSVEMSTADIMRIMDEKYLSCFDAPMLLDESTVRKKLKEYCDIGIVESVKQGKRTLYRRMPDSAEIDEDMLDFYSEVAPCGVIGSFLLDKTEGHESIFSFKHHYITSALDSEVVCTLLEAMREKRAVSVVNNNRGKGGRNKIIPLRIFVSAQSGRQHLLAYDVRLRRIHPFRVDYLSNVVKDETLACFDELRARLDEAQSKMWGVIVKDTGKKELERVEFTIKLEKGEEFIAQRLERERRIGTVERLDDNTYRFSAEVYDTSEMIPWIRTFICRITELDFSNKEAQARFESDLEAMYKMYAVEEDNV